jgi:hypothetical protein
MKALEFGIDRYKISIFWIFQQKRAQLNNGGREVMVSCPADLCCRSPLTTS